MSEMDDFTHAYMTAALWSTTDESDDQGGEPLDANYSIDDIAPHTRARMIQDCEEFQRRYGNLIDGGVNKESEYTDRELAGHDFWLTRNGHGGGFWDGDWKPNVEKVLDKAAEEYGQVDLYVGDDGQIYASGGGHEANEGRRVRASRRVRTGRRVRGSGGIAGVVTYSMPSRWASYLINGDGSGIEDEDIDEADAAIKEIDLGSPVDVSDGSFRHRGDFGSMGDDYSDYTFHVSSEETPLVRGGAFRYRSLDDLKKDGDLEERRVRASSARHRPPVTHFSPGDRVSVGHTGTRDYNTGTIERIEGNQAYVKWRRPGTHPWTDLARLDQNGKMGELRANRRGPLNEYMVVDRRDRETGPYDSYANAKAAADLGGGVVKFRPKKRSPLRENDNTEHTVSKINDGTYKVTRVKIDGNDATVSFKFRSGTGSGSTQGRADSDHMIAVIAAAKKQGAAISRTLPRTAKRPKAKRSPARKKRR